ncbi:universal stress protein [Haloplanus halobius]|uniref:universal stress protein n=1 Tax=Haloplanus halobius TaxID=2934938 RepID=UPI00200E28DD|nr:universal stress protein [Haloplanus sp. XH21]
MYDSILVPIDGSGPSDAALDHARGLATQWNATVHVIHAIALPEPSMPGGDVPPTVIEDIEAESEQLVEDAIDDLEADGIDAEGGAFDGVAEEVIRDYVADHDIDLVVMGTHGRTGVKRLLLGSTTERTLRTVDVPILTVESPP